MFQKNDVVQSYSGPVYVVKVCCIGSQALTYEGELISPDDFHKIGTFIPDPKPIEVGATVTNAGGRWKGEVLWMKDSGDFAVVQGPVGDLSLCRSEFLKVID